MADKPTMFVSERTRQAVIDFLEDKKSIIESPEFSEASLAALQVVRKEMEARAISSEIPQRLWHAPCTC